MKILSFLTGLTVALMLMACDKTQETKDLKLWYQQPADASIPDLANGWQNDSEWLKALPIGNGSLGGMVYGGVGLERIQLNEKSLWSGSPADNDNPEAFPSIDSIRNLLYSGKYQEAHQLAQETQICQGAGSGHGNGARVPFGCFQTLGDLWIQSEGSGPFTDYYRDLNLMTGVAQVWYQQDGVHFERTVFSSFPDQVLVAQFTADRAGSLNFTCSMNRPEHYSTFVNEGQLILSGQLINGTGGGGMEYIARLKAINQGGTIIYNDSTLTIQGADAVTLLLSAATTYMPEPPTYSGNPYGVLSAQRLQAAENYSFEQLLKRHTADFQSFMERVDFDLTPDEDPDTLPTDVRIQRFKETQWDPRLTELYFQYGRYLLVASSREGSLPANLQGLWANKIQTPWNCDYHTDINIQMNYWPVEVTNLSELQMPLTELIESLVIPGTKTAQVHYQAAGWCVHPITNVFGFTAPGESPSWGLHLGAGAWMVQHLWEHYAFTGDLEYLQRVYPVMKGSAEFYLDWLVEDPISGKLVSGPASSPENSFIGPDGSRGYLTMGPSHDQEVIWDLFTNILEAADMLKITDDFTQQVAAARAHLLLPKIGSDGRLMEWPFEFEEIEPGHRHMSHLFALHPGRQINSSTPEMQEAARKSLYFRLANGGGHTGWSAAWLVNLWARLGEGDQAKKAVDLLLTKCTSPNFFDLHPPFQIDGNFGGTAGIAEMLLQSHTGEIVLLPALPSDWKTGKMTGLLARGGFEIGMEWEEGKLDKTRIYSKNGGTCTLRYQDQTKTLETKKGEHIQLGANWD